MSYICLAVGVTILVLVISDIVITTLAPHGAGKITTFTSRYSWKIFLFLSQNYGSHKILNRSGMLVIVVVFTLWIIFLWAGYALIFCVDENSIVNINTGKAATIHEKFYYVGYTLSTLGYGDFQGTSSFWRIFSSFISFTGLILITIAVTYLVPITSAEIAKRKLSIYIASLGSSPQEILINGWDGTSFRRLNDHFTNLTNLILQLGQNHSAYPVLHYFHTSNKEEAITINLTALDEAVSILFHFIPKEKRPIDQAFLPLRRAITSYLHTLVAAHIKPAEKAPKSPEIGIMNKFNIPFNEDEENFKTCYKKLEKRRKILLSLLKNDGWTWDDMQGPKFQSEFEL